MLTLKIIEARTSVWLDESWNKEQNSVKKEVTSGELVRQSVTV